MNQFYSTSITRIKESLYAVHSSLDKDSTISNLEVIESAFLDGGLGRFDLNLLANLLPMKILNSVTQKVELEKGLDGIDSSCLSQNFLLIT